MESDLLAKPTLPLPKYYRLKQALTKYIEQNRDKSRPGADLRLPSEPELIRTYKVSQITVRRALSELEKEGQIYKVNGKGTFVKTSQFPSKDSMTATKTIGAFFYGAPDTEEPWYWHSDFIKCIRQAAYGQGYNLLSLSPSTFKGENLKIFLDSKPVNGLIVHCPRGSEYEKALAGQFHCIFTDAGSAPKRDYWITLDFNKGATLAMDHLVKNGHRDIAVIWVDDDTTRQNRTRLETGLKVLRKNGIRPSPALVRSTWYWESNGYDTMTQLLAERQAGTLHFSAVYVTEVLVGLGAVRAIKEHRLAIPDDISVVFCNSVSYLNFIEPRIAHVREPDQAWAQALVNNLVLLIKGKKPDIKEHYLEPELVPGDSVKNITSL